MCSYKLVDSTTGLADDMVNDKEEVPRLRNVVRVIPSVEGDRGFRPFQEGRGSLAHGGPVNLLAHELLATSGLARHWSTKNHEAPFRIKKGFPLLLIADGSRRRVCASYLVVTFEVEFDEVIVFKGVFDWVAMVVAW